MYTCVMIIIYIMINLVDAPSVHMVPGLIFYLFNINYNKANLKQKNQYYIFNKLRIAHAAAPEVLFIFSKSQNEYICL